MNCGNCKHYDRGHCRVPITADDRVQVTAVLPFACLKRDLSWRAEVGEDEGEGCVKWEAKP